MLPRLLPEKGKYKIHGGGKMKGTVKRDFKVLTEKISPENIAVMAELIAMRETKTLIGFMGYHAEKAHKKLCKDIFCKDKPGFTLSDSYDLVQNVALLLCNHCGEYLDDFLYISAKGKPITIKMECYLIITRMLSKRYRLMQKYQGLEEAKENSKTCKLKPIRQKDLEDLVLQTTSQLLGDEETLSAIADEIEVMHAKMRKDRSVLCSLLAQREKAQKSLNNLLKAIEEGILTATTKTRMTELEEQIALLDIKIKGETQKEEQVITKDQVIAYLRNIAKYESRFLINVFVKEIVLYNDKIEIYYYYTDKKDPDEPTDKVHRDLTFHYYNVRVQKTYFGLLTKIKKDTAHCSRSSTVSLLVRRKRFELLAFGSVDQRSIQLS